LKNRNLVFYSPNITRPMLRDYYARKVFLFDDWTPLVQKLKELHPGRPTVSVFPCGASQMDRAVLGSEDALLQKG